MNTTQSETLGGRFPLLKSQRLSASQKEVYDLLNKTMIPWAEKAGLSEEAIQELARGELPDELSEQENIAQRYVRQLSAEHRVEADLYRAAEQAFEKQGLVDMTFLTGAYHTICALLNGFEIPVPE